MIFHKSLSKKKGAAYSYVSGLSSAFLPTLLICIFLTVIMAVLPFAEFISINSEANKDITGMAKTAKDMFEFSVFGSTVFLDTAIIYIILGVLGLLSILTAVRIFNFICDKRTVNVYYSLGIKRTTLFLSKYASGALFLCAATLIPVILSYIVNTAFLGLSWRLIIVLLQYYCGISVFLLLCYSFTACVFSSVGTVSEAIVYSVALLFAPTIFFFILENIVGAFLPTSTLNTYIEHFTQNAYTYGSSGISYLEATAKYNPVLFFADEMFTFGVGSISDGEILLKATEEKWRLPDIFIHFPWFITASAAALLGTFLFRRIKAENCGFLNTNKVLSNLMIFELCLFGSCLFLSEMRWTPPAIVLSMGAAVAFVLYLIAEIFLKRSLKKILTSLYKFVAHAAVIAIIFTICATGAFGYDTYIPDINKVESVEVAIPFSYTQISTMRKPSGWMSDGFIYTFEDYRKRFLPEMTESEDIEAIINMHEYINRRVEDDGTRCSIVIRYNLKNGSYSQRKLSLTNKSEVSELFTLFDTKSYKNELYDMFFEENRLDNIKSLAAVYSYVDDYIIRELAFEYEYSNVFARAPSLRESRLLKLTEEDFCRLKKAVYDDLAMQSASDYLTGDAKQLGVISFDINEKAYKIEGVNGYDPYYDNSIYNSPDIYFEEPVTSITMPVPEFPQYEIPEEDIMLPEESSVYSEYLTDLYSCLGGMQNAQSYDIIVTEKMANTLSLLKELGMSDCFSEKLEIESVSFRKIHKESDYNFNYGDSDTIREFFAYPLYPDDIFIAPHETGNNDIVSSVSENIITDKEKITELNTIMKLHEYTFSEGYYCLIKYTDGLFCVRYLSDSDAPDYVKNYNYTYEEYYG